MGVIGIILGVTDPAHHPTTSLPASGATAIAFFYIWTAFYSMGWNGTPWVVNSESFPGSVRQVCSTFAAASNWLWNFVISRATPEMFRTMGHSGFGVVSNFKRPKCSQGLTRPLAVPLLRRYANRIHILRVAAPARNQRHCSSFSPATRCPR